MAFKVIQGHWIQR